MIVDALKQSPKNGAEIMEGIEKLSNGWWKPSPGSMYPALAEMSEEGIIRKREDGRYLLANIDHPAELSPFFPRRGNNPSEILAEMESFVLYLQDLSDTGVLSGDDFTRIGKIATLLREISAKGRER